MHMFGAWSVIICEYVVEKCFNNGWISRFCRYSIDFFLPSQLRYPDVIQAGCEIVSPMKQSGLSTC